MLDNDVCLSVVINGVSLVRRMVRDWEVIFFS